MKISLRSVVPLAAVIILVGISLAAFRSASFEMTPQASSPITAGYAGMYAKSGDGKPHLVTAAGVDYAAGDAWHLHTTAGAPGSLVLGDCWTDSTDSYKVWCKESSGNLRQRFDGAAPGNIGCGTPAAGCFSSVSISGAQVEAFFSRTCTITSAAAATPVTCLSDADVPATLSAHVLGWHIKVNGATAWATTATCTIQDAASTGFSIIAVAALTANAFAGDLSANVTLLSAYSLNLGGTADKGLQIVCNANGTGSDLVVTLYGVIK